jgi:hypothetical protein
MSTAFLSKLEDNEVRLAPELVDDDLYEVVDGLRVEIPPMSSYAAKVATRLATRLNIHAERENLGEAIVESLFWGRHS